MKDTILIDFDGVIRHWTGPEVFDAEAELGINKGTLFACAFSDKMLLPAIAGEINHETWQTRVTAQLAQQHGEDIADQLKQSWNTASWEIDHPFLADLNQAAPDCKFVLVTNATSSLNADLQQSGLADAFDAVVNSSQINVAKPEHRFFEQALAIADSDVNRALFIDDSLDNIQTAQSMGIESIHHQNTEETLAFIRQWFI